MYLVKTPRFVDKLYSNRIWRLSANSKKVFLTFDDGPIPELTPWILDLLLDKQIKATFFCVGDNVRKYPEIYQRILDEGHRVGNHTFNHMNGAKHSDIDYINNVDQCADLVDSKLFRPPYGRLSKQKEKALLLKGYNVVMWDVLSGDFDPLVNVDKCKENVLNNVKAGSIIVMHDNEKAESNLKGCLEEIIDSLLGDAYVFNVLDESLIVK